MTSESSPLSRQTGEQRRAQSSIALAIARQESRFDRGGEARDASGFVDRALQSHQVPHAIRR